MSKPKQPTIQRIPYKASRSIVLPVDDSGALLSLDEGTRSVEFIASTEDAVMVMDWERWEVVPEVLLMSGVRIPESKQVPLLDTHSRESVSKVLGSFRNIHVSETEHGRSLVGRAYFSTVKDADEAFIKVKERHITDVSVGYEVLAHIWLNAGESTTVENTTFTGPLRIAVEWNFMENSLCPIGADPNAKSRSTPQNQPARKTADAGHNKEKAMPNIIGGTQSARKRAGLLARLRNLLSGQRAEEEEPKKEEVDDETTRSVDIVDENGETVSTDELSDDELIELVEQMEEVITEAETALAGDGERKSASRGVVSLKGRNLSPSQIATAERSRVQAIRAMSTAHNLPQETEDKLINSGVSLEHAKAQVLDMINQRASQNTGPGFSVSVGTTEQQKITSAIQDGLLMRCGLPLWKYAPGSPEFRAEQPGQRALREAAAGAHELQGYTMRELARMMLQRSGQRTDGHVGQMVGRALATTDLPTLLVETSRRTLMEAFEVAEETWRIWASTGIATDFKKSTAVGLEGDVKPVRKPEGGEYQTGRLAETAEEYKIETFGRKMVITREAIINDDLNALTALPRLYGEQTAELVGDVAYAALLSNPKMGDGHALFDAKHKNLYAGLAGVPTVASIGKVVTGMKLQKDSFGKTITVKPTYFLAPVALETASDQFFDTQLQGAPVQGTQAAPLVHNPYGGKFFTRVHDRRMDDVSPEEWYLLGARGTVTVFFLGGVEAPYVEEQINFNTDGVESKVRMDVGAKAMRHVTMSKATKK